MLGPKSSYFASSINPASWVWCLSQIYALWHKDLKKKIYFRGMMYKIFTVLHLLEYNVPSVDAIFPWFQMISISSIMHILQYLSIISNDLNKFNNAYLTISFNLHRLQVLLNSTNQVWCWRAHDLVEAPTCFGSLYNEKKISPHQKDVLQS